MKLMIAAGVRDEAKWVSPLLAAEAEFGPTIEGGVRPAFTSTQELTPQQRTRIAQLAPVPPGTRARAAAVLRAKREAARSSQHNNLAPDVRTRPSNQIVFPEDAARSVFLKVSSGQVYDSDGNLRFDGRRTISRPHACLVDGKPFTECDSFISRARELSQGADDARGLELAAEELKKELEVGYKVSVAVEATGSMVRDDHLDDEVSRSLKDLFDLMDKTKASGRGKYSDGARHRSSAAEANGKDSDESDVSVAGNSEETRTDLSSPSDQSDGAPQTTDDSPKPT